MNLDSHFYPHSVQVHDLEANSSRGPKHATTARTLRAEVLDEAALVRGADGEEVVSSARVTVPLEANVVLGSLVTIWPGTAQQRQAPVLQVERNENPAPMPSYLVLAMR